MTIYIVYNSKFDSVMSIKSNLNLVYEDILSSYRYYNDIGVDLYDEFGIYCGDDLLIDQWIVYENEVDSEYTIPIEFGNSSSIRLLSKYSDITPYLRDGKIDFLIK